MGAGSRIAHQTHAVGVGGDGTPGDGPSTAAGISYADGRIWYQPEGHDSSRISLDPDTGELHRYPAGATEATDLTVHNVTAGQWQQLVDGGGDLDEQLSTLAGLPGHQQPRVPDDDDARSSADDSDGHRLVEALRRTVARSGGDGDAVGGGMGSSTPVAVTRQAARAAERALDSEHAASVSARDAARQDWPKPDGPSYVEHPEEFQRAYQAARQRAAAGEPVVPYMTDNATGGLGARDGGRAFGVELEFDLPAGRDQAAVRQAIARDLHAAGLTRDSRVYGYHSGRSTQGYSDATDGWRLETDVSVSGGELVSPIMYDEPATWANLQTACEIIRRHGGEASIRAGSHVTVSARDYDHTVENHNRLLNTVAEHEDTLYRIATDPARGTHRVAAGSNYCRPNQVPATGYGTVDEVRWRQSGHHQAVNLAHSNGNSNDRVEFRLWDATLDPAVIQTQINMSLGLTAAAFRGTTGAGPAGGRQRLGTHRRAADERRQSRLRGSAWQTATSSFRRLMDGVFSRAANREQATALFAATRWQRG